MSKLDSPLFRSEYTSSDNTLNELENSDPNKAAQANDIPVKTTQKYKGNCSFFIRRNFNSILLSSTFLTALKIGNIKRYLLK